MARSSTPSGLRRLFVALLGGSRSPSPSPGRGGTSATVQVDPGALRNVHLDYSPTPNGAPDPGEVVWTWVPYEENDGRGKDRPVVIIASEPDGGFLAVQLTSKEHDSRDYLSLGTGPWDPQGRPSWVILDRVFRVNASGVRRQAAALDRQRYDRMVAALRTRYRWS